MKPSWMLPVALWLVALTLACSNEDSPADQGASQADVSAYCRDLLATAQSLQAVQGAFASLDEAAFREAVRTTGALLDELATESQGFGDQSRQVADLRQDVMELLTMLTSPDLGGAAPLIEEQAAEIQRDLNEMAANC